MPFLICIGLNLIGDGEQYGVYAGHVSMFEITTGDNWPDVMHAAMDAVGVGLQPVLNHSSQNGIYFVAIICLLYFLMANVFTGVLMEMVRKISTKSWPS